MTASGPSPRTLTPRTSRRGWSTFRPIDPAKFSGTVVVEWLNVSAGADLPTDWIMAHNEFVRQGDAYVGVSAQAVGVNALKTQQPDRYGTLVHPGDSYSYDIFSQAGRQVRANPATVLGGLTAQRVIGAGESQSASRLVTYIDGIHPLGAGVRRLHGAQPLVRWLQAHAGPAPGRVGALAAAIRNDLDATGDGRPGGGRRHRLEPRRPPARHRDASASGSSPARRTRTRTRSRSAAPTSATAPARRRCSRSCAARRTSGARTR